MIVNISATEDKFVIRFKHRVTDVFEKRIEQKKFFSKRSFYLFVLTHLFFSFSILILKEIFMRYRK